MKQVLFILVLLIQKNYANITNIAMSGLSDPMPPVRVSLLTFQRIGTVISVLGFRNQDTSINFLNQENRTTFSINLASLPHAEESLYHLSILCEEKGYRLYFKGEEIRFSETYVETATSLSVNQTGTLKIVVYYLEPVWTMDESYHNIKIYNYEPLGSTAFPKIYDLVDYNSIYLQNGDYLMITGEILEKKEINIELRGKDLSPLRVTFQPNKGKFTLKAINRAGKEEGVQSYKRLINTTGRFTVTLVLEKLGWRMYYNGDEFAYYFHQFSASYIKQLRLYGTSDGEKSWKLQKVSWRHV